ncbi:MAG: hypothetical protein ACD_39C01001G0003 [uncultured bacterium]|nr:MAG: hypothetical protein ACD_39C01001G0003 [uncultured bacterium]
MPDSKNKISQRDRQLLPADTAKCRYATPGKGFSLVEIMIGMVILASVAGSIFAAFSASKSLLVSSREISIATSLAGSYLSAASSIELKNIIIFAPTDESELPEPFKPASLNIMAAPEPFKRSISLLAHDQEGLEGGPFYQLRVEISWQRHETGTTATYNSSTLLQGSTK